MPIDTMAGDEAARRATDNAREFARVFLMVRHRQRGCDGMGEFHALKEEFREAIAQMVEARGGETQVLDDDALGRLAEELAREA